MRHSESKTGPCSGDTHQGRISVVIPHLNQPEMLRRCLASLQAGQRQADEIIVVDNGSTTLPTAICAAYPGVQLLQEPTPGPGPARNRGVAASTADVLAFIDADCIAAPDWLATAEIAMTDPAATILGGDVRIDCANPARLTMLEAYESIYAYRMDRYIAREGFTGTGNLVVRRVVLADVGPFAGIGVAEDRDWGQRASAKGYRIRFVADMLVYHPARDRIVDLFVKWDRQSAHDYVRARDRRRGMLRYGLKALVMPVSFLAELPEIMTSDRLTNARARGLALACLIRVRLHRSRVMLRLLLTGNPDRLSGAWNRN